MVLTNFTGTGVGFGIEFNRKEIFWRFMGKLSGFLMPDFLLQVLALAVVLELDGDLEVSALIFYSFMILAVFSFRYI